MIVSRPPQPRRKRRSRFRFVFIIATTTTMVATGGFGAFPENPLSQTFQEVIGENIPADFLDPFNSYMDSISAPQIPLQPGSASENESPPDPLGFFENLFAGSGPASESQLPSEQDIVGAAMDSIAETQTYLASLSSDTPTPTLTLTPTNTLTFTPTYTLTPTLTVSPVVIYQAPVINPPPANNPVPMPTITPSPTDTLMPFLGFNITNADLSGMGTYAIVSPGELVNVTYDFEVYDDPCPGCITQLVTGLGMPATDGGACAFDGDAGLSSAPVTGFEDVMLTAPMAPGIYSVVVEYYWETGCFNALSLYGTGTGQQAPSQGVGLIEVQSSSIVLYEGAEVDGNIGVRATADSTCAAANPTGYANARAFIAYSSADSIANMPVNYGVPTTLPIQSTTSVTIANDWSDLMDGNIATTLSSAGVTTKSYWWSGVENADGTHLDGVTENCSGWTSNILTAGGSYGYATTFTDTNWMVSPPSAGCSNFPGTVLLCIAYP